jgi:multiple sugar transport system permease protein
MTAETNVEVKPVEREAPRKHASLTGRKRRQQMVNLLAYLILGIGAIITIVPFYWMVSTSLKSIAEIMRFPPTLFPEVIHFENYTNAFLLIPFNIFFRNSAFVSTMVVVGQLFTCSLAGYSFARLNFPGKNFIFLLYLSAQMVPFAVVMIPLYMIMRTIGWLDHLTALIVPGLVSVFGTFLMRQFYSTIPKELEDAARIDGCSYFRLYWTILLPLSTPALATLGILTFMNTWNDFMWPLIVISKIPAKTLPLGLNMLIEQQAVKTPWHLFNAAGVFAILPILVVFMLGQKYYVRGIITSGIKGGG